MVNEIQGEELPIDLRFSISLTLDNINGLILLALIRGWWYNWRLDRFWRISRWADEQD